MSWLWSVIVGAGIAVNIMVVIALLAAVADVVTTNMAIAKNGYELNPIEAWFQKQLKGLWWIGRIGLELIPIAGCYGITNAATSVAIGILFMENLYILMTAWNNYQISVGGGGN